MNTKQVLSSRILISGILQRSNNEVRVIFKENRLVRDRPNTRRLRQLLEPLGIRSEVGDWVGSTAFLAIDLKREGRSLTKVEVVRALASDNVIEFSPQVSA
jgi:hypothetical protein